MGEQVFKTNTTVSATNELERYHTDVFDLIYHRWICKLKLLEVALLTPIANPNATNKLPVSEGSGSGRSGWASFPVLGTRFH